MEAAAKAIIDCFQYMNHTVTEAHNKELLHPLMMDEVSIVVKQLLAGKAPGVDTKPADIYQIMWEDIQLNIFNFVFESICHNP